MKKYLIMLLFLLLTSVFLFVLNKRITQTKELEYKLNKLQQEQTAKKEKEYELDLCLFKAEEAYRSRWNDHCKKLNKDNECLLPRLTANDYADDLKARKEDCYKRFNI